MKTTQSYIGQVNIEDLSDDFLTDLVISNDQKIENLEKENESIVKEFRRRAGLSAWL